MSAKNSSFLAFLAVIVSVLSGCADLLAGMKPKVVSVPAANPLEGGSVLRASRPPLERTLGGSPTQRGVRPDDCTRWPVEDTYAVRIEGDTLCLDVTRTIGTGTGIKNPTMADESFSEQTLLLATDTGRGPAMSLVPQRGASKVNECTSGGQVYDVWTRTFSGCTPNGPQLLTPASRWLAVQRNSPAGEIDEARWTFPPTSSTVVTSAAAPSASATSPVPATSAGAARKRAPSRAPKHRRR
jgi:hypothetical protein